MAKRNRTLNEYDAFLVGKIADRAVALAQECDVPVPRVQVIVALAMGHRIIPIDLHMLLDADDANFAHDVFGLVKHVNIRAQKIERCFVPRMAVSNHT